MIVNAVVPLAGAAAPGRSLELRVAGPRPGAASGIGAFFDRRGFSLVAGRAALVAAGTAPRDEAEAAAAAGAAAVLLEGMRLPSGSLGVDGAVPVPVVGIDAADGRALRAALASGANVGVSIGPLRSSANPAYGRVAAFSSQGLAFDGAIKPELVGPGVGVVTSAPGTNPDGSPRFETVSGTSIAAAAVAGAAALLVQARPALDAADLKSLLVGTARPLASASLAAQGAGLVELRAADSASIAAEPATLSLSPATPRTAVTVRNLSPRMSTIQVSTKGTATARPAQLELAPGGSGTVTVTGSPGEGAVVLAVEHGRRTRVPLFVSAPIPSRGLISNLSLSSSTLNAATLTPALLTVRLGALGQGPAVVPVSRFDANLVAANGQALGLLIRLRDALPGNYAFALTGTAPSGARLAPGRYSLRLVAYPTDGGPPTRRAVPITVR